MKANLLSPDKDPMGAAITDYFHHQKAGKLRVFSSQFEEDCTLQIYTPHFYVI